MECGVFIVSWRQLQTACLHERIRHCLPGCSVRFPQMLECRSDPQPMKIEEPMFENQPLPPTDLVISTNISTNISTTNWPSNIIYLAETLLSHIFQFLLILLLSLKSLLIIESTPWLHHCKCIMRHQFHLIQMFFFSPFFALSHSFLISYFHIQLFFMLQVFLFSWSLFCLFL